MNNLWGMNNKRFAFILMNCRLNLAPRVHIFYETNTYIALCMLTQLKVKNTLLTSVGKLHYIVCI